MHGFAYASQPDPHVFTGTTAAPALLAPGYSLPRTFVSRDSSGDFDPPSDDDNDNDNEAGTTKAARLLKEGKTVVVKFNTDGPLGVQFLQDSDPPLAISNIASDGLAAKSPYLKVGMVSKYAHRKM